MLNKIIGASFLYLFFASFVAGAKLEATDAEIFIQEQVYQSSISFHQAYNMAFFSLFNDSEDQESLLSLIMAVFPDKQQAQQELDRIMNEESTVLKLEGVLDDNAPHGEMVEDNWIFSLKTSDYDHVFYIIISRCGLASYNYGFN